MSDSRQKPHRSWSQTVGDLLRRPTKIKLDLSVYGKLPIYKEFLKHNLATKEAHGFKKWLDEGMGHFWPRHTECTSMTIRPYGFVMSFPSAKHKVLGVLWGSHDEGGLRSFPFAVFSSWPRRTGFLPSFQVLDVLRQLVERSVALRPELETAESPQSAIRKVAAIGSNYELRSRPVLREELQETFGDLTLADFGRSLYEEESEENWLALLSYLKGRLHAGPAQGGLRLPGSAAFSPWLALVLWRSLLDRLGNGHTPAVQLLLPIDAECDEGPVFFFHPPRPDDVYALCPAMNDYDLLEDLRQEVPSVSADDLDTGIDREQKLSDLVAPSV